MLVTLRWICLPLAVAAALVVVAPCPAPPLPKGKENDTTTPATDEAKPVAGNARNDAASAENLKQIALAMHNYHDAHNAFPGDITDKAGKPLLSWRVRLLPYMEMDHIYKKLKLDEPWDSKHNIKVLAEMPKVFASPRVTLKRKGYTVYQGFSGKAALFQPGKAGRRMLEITDGTSNTILAVEATAAVPWTKPADILFDEKKDLPKFGKAFGERPLAAMCDGSTRVLDLKKISKETLKGAITVQGGEVLGQDWE